MAGGFKKYPSKGTTSPRAGLVPTAGVQAGGSTDADWLKMLGKFKPSSRPLTAKKKTKK